MSKSLFTTRHDRLRALLVSARKRARLRQVDVALTLQKPQSFVSKYESGERQLDVMEFIDVADAIDASATAIIEDLISITSSGRQGRRSPKSR